MNFFEVILVIVLVGLLSALTSLYFACAISGNGKNKIQNFKKNRIPLLVGTSSMVVLYIFILSVRSLDFGVDTATYASLFHDFCSGDKDVGNDASFIYSLNWLNFFMLGACEVNLLPMAWGAGFMAPFFFMKMKFNFKIYFLSLLLFSIIGVEFTTNALRQGFSIGFLIIAISYFDRKNIIAVIFLIVSILFHSSSFLVFAMYILTKLRRRVFYFCFFFTIFLVCVLVNYEINIPIISSFMYEIKKYLSHDGDEIFIRAFAFLSLISIYLLSIGSNKFYSDESIEFRLMALRLCFLCIPFLWLPYFGYRIVYGVYPVVLFLIMKDIASRKKSDDREVAIILVFNIIIILVWAIGSNHMRNTNFI